MLPRKPYRIEMSYFDTDLFGMSTYVHQTLTVHSMTRSHAMRSAKRHVKHSAYRPRNLIIHSAKAIG